MPALIRAPQISLAILFGVVGGVATAQEADKSFEISIPAGELPNSLEKLGQQSGVQIMYEPAVARGIRVAAVNGTLTVRNALTQLLAQTGLKADEVNEKTVVLKRDEAKNESEAVKKGQEDLSTANRPGHDSSETLQEILVTAQKREERLQDVPISISVLRGEDLGSSTTQGVTEALSRVPGVAVTETYQGGGTQVAVRGVTAGDALANGSSPVSYYLDSVPFGFVRHAIAPDLNAYDLERVEVLRGPQGTLYGASALNGVVRVLTKDANPDAFELKARVLDSSTEGGGGNSRADMAINLPVIEGKLAARAVLGYQDLGGWIDRPNKRNANDAEISNIRFKVNAQPTKQLSIGASAWLMRSDYGGPSLSDDHGVRLATHDEPIATDFDTYSLKLAYALPSVSVTSTTSYLEYSNKNDLDVGALVPDYLTSDLFSSDVLSEEVTLNSQNAGPWRWSLGGMYRDAEDLQFQSSRLGPDVFQVADQTYISKSFAVFGELTRSFHDGKIELTGGLRYFEDDVTMRDDLRSIRSNANFDTLSPRVVLTWHPNTDLMVYGSYAEGFRSGFPQTGLLLEVAPQFPPLKADTLHNYELGAKGSLWDGRISVDTALYYIDWQDVQQSLTVPVGQQAVLLTTAQINSESASGLGFDLGVTARPLEGLELSVNFGWNDLAMDADVVPGGVLLFAKGDRLNVSPEYIVGASAEYVFPIGASGFKGRFSASANYTSEMDIRTIVDGARSIADGDSMLIARTSLAIEAATHWTATLFIDNINDERGSAVRFPFYHDFLPWDTRVRPRTVGLQLECSF